MLGDFLTRATAATIYLAKAGGTMTGALVLAGDATEALHPATKQQLDAKADTTHAHAASAITSGTLDAARVPDLDAAKITTGVLAIARLATGTPDGTKFVRDDGTLAVPAGGGGSAGTAQVERYRIRRALLEPRLLRHYRGTGSTAIPSDETHYLTHSYATRIDGAAGIARMEQRSVTGGPLPLRNITIEGIQTASFWTLLDPTDATYADAVEAYYEALNLIEERPTRYKQISGAADYATVPFCPWPGGAIMLHVGIYNTTWGILQNELGDTANGTVHQEMRFTDRICHPFTLDQHHVLGWGEYDDWGEVYPDVDAPAAWALYVNLPGSYHGVTTDRYAPYGYLHTIDTTDGTPANVTLVNGTAGLVTVAGALDTAPDWFKMIGGASAWANGYYGTDTFAPNNGRAYITEVHKETGSAGVFGVAATASVHHNAIVHGIYFNGATLETLHDGDGSGGAARTDRTVTGVQLYDGYTYRFKIGFLGSGGATYGMQTNHPTLGATYPLGGDAWYDLLQGTTAAATAAHASLRMVAGTANNTNVWYNAFARITKASGD